MPKLSDLNPSAQRKIMLVGEPGSGKTVFLLGFEGRKYVADFDAKISSGAEFYRTDKPRLESVDYDIYMGSGMMPKFETKVRELEELAAKSDFPYSLIALDSLTTFLDRVIDHVISTNGSIQRTRTQQGPIASQLDYRIGAQYAKQLIHRLLVLPCHVVVTAHLHIEKDELTGRIERRAKGFDSVASYLPVVFEEVWRTYVETKGTARSYRAQLQSDDFFSKARSQLRNAPQSIELSYSALCATGK